MFPLPCAAQSHRATQPWASRTVSQNKHLYTSKEPCVRYLDTLTKADWTISVWFPFVIPRISVMPYWSVPARLSAQHKASGWRVLHPILDYHGLREVTQPSNQPPHGRSDNRKFPEKRKSEGFELFNHTHTTCSPLGLPELANSHTPLPSEPYRVMTPFLRWENLKTQKGWAWRDPKAGLSPPKGVAGEGTGWQSSVKDGSNNLLSGLIDLAATRSIFAFSWQRKQLLKEKEGEVEARITWGLIHYIY